VVSPEQESHRLHEAQELLRDLNILLKEEDTPGIEIISSLMKRAEAFTLQTAHNPDMDSQTRKTLEDINALLVSARQLGRNKHISDRLQKITEETQKVLQSVRGPAVTAVTREATENLMEFMTNWRPLFYLLTSSRDFRTLLLDTSSIARRIIYSHTQDLREETKQKFAQGVPVRDIAMNIKDKAKEKAQDTKQEVVYAYTGDLREETTLKFKDEVDPKEIAELDLDKKTRGKSIPQLSDEEWNRLQDDVQRVLVLLAKQPTFREGITRIFSLLDLFQKSIAQKPLQETIVPDNIHIRRIAQETEEIIASFCGRETLDRFKNYLRNLILQIQKNDNLQEYLQELKEFILKTKSEEEIRSKEFRSQSKELAYRGRELMRELREQEDLILFLEAADDMVNNIKNDEFLQILRQQAGIVQSDLSFMDSQGKVQVDTGLLSKLQSVLLPTLVDALKYIPVPRIYSNDNEREFWLDNLVICSYDIIPDNIKFHLETDSEVSVRDIEVKGTQTYLVIVLDKILTELKEISFFYRKKTFPSFEDQGKVTFRIKGNGAKLTFTYTLLQGPQDTVPRIREGYASFDITDMSIEFDKSTLTHDMMVPLLTQLFKVQIRQQIEKEVENNLTGFMKKVGEMMSKSLTEINRPFRTGLEAAKEVVKSSQLAQVYQKRREILE